MDPVTIQDATRRSLSRLLPTLRREFAASVDRPVWAIYERRLQDHFPDLFRLLLGLYGNQYDFFYHLEQILVLTARCWLDRPADLQELDAQRERSPRWFQSEQMLGGVCYVDLFAGDLRRLQAKIPYFQELGLTYLHLMPLFKTPEGRKRWRLRRKRLPGSQPIAWHNG